MKRTRTVAALAAVALIVALTATAHASGSGDAQGPKPFADCADIVDHTFNVGLSDPVISYPYGEGVPLIHEPGEVERETFYVTEVTVNVFLANARCPGRDGEFGTADDTASFVGTLLFPKQVNESEEIVELTLSETSYSVEEQKISFTYDLTDQKLVRNYVDYQYDEFGDRKFYDSGEDGSDVCAEARSSITRPSMLSDVSPDLLADGSRDLESIMAEFCEDSSRGASAKAG